MMQSSCTLRAGAPAAAAHAPRPHARVGGLQHKAEMISCDVFIASWPAAMCPSQELVSGDREPITPFICRLPALAARGVSCVLVIGGSGQYFDVAGGRARRALRSPAPVCEPYCWQLPLTSFVVPVGAQGVLAFSPLAACAPVPEASSQWFLLGLLATSSDPVQTLSYAWTPTCLPT